MTKRSIFRDFMSALRKRWKSELPVAQPLKAKCGHLPKASTFHAGIAKGSDLHVYLYFQLSPKAWEVGQFTINIMLTADSKDPKWGYAELADGRLAEGSYRIRQFLGTKDKWWHLKADRESISSLAWRPSSYANPETVVAEAVEEATKDVKIALKRLNIL